MAVSLTSRDSMSKATQTHVVPEILAGKPLDGVVRALAGGSWGKARGLIETGKVRVDGEVVTATDRRVRAGVTIAIDPNAPKPRPDRLEDDRIVFVDPHVVVVDKPSGISTIPYADETGTLDERVRSYLSKLERDRSMRPAVGVVHRIDKETSGLVVFTRTWLAKQSLSQQFRFHTVHRLYLAIVHGAISKQTLRSHLDGLRGSIEALRGKKPPLSQGQLAITHVEVRERLAGASLIACRLETGRTHQIRIHLSEAGHPLVGERVYARDFERRGGEVIPAPRLMLHAAELGFDHPKTSREVRFESPLPKDFEETLARLRAARDSR
jgi:23S rRNA pseudouridine1911/1915/1917 synthase